MGPQTLNTSKHCNTMYHIVPWNTLRWILTGSLYAWQCLTFSMWQPMTSEPFQSLSLSESRSRDTSGELPASYPTEKNHLSVGTFGTQCSCFSYWKWPFIVHFPIKNGDFPSQQQFLELFKCSGSLWHSDTGQSPCATQIFRALTPATCQVCQRI